MLPLSERNRNVERNNGNETWHIDCRSDHLAIEWVGCFFFFLCVNGTDTFDFTFFTQYSFEACRRDCTTFDSWCCDIWWWYIEIHTYGHNRKQKQHQAGREQMEGKSNKKTTTIVMEIVYCSYFSPPFWPPFSAALLGHFVFLVHTYDIPSQQKKKKTKKIVELKRTKGQKSIKSYEMLQQIHLSQEFEKSFQQGFHRLFSLWHFIHFFDEILWKRTKHKSIRFLFMQKVN